jgi:hypothetical protein
MDLSSLLAPDSITGGAIRHALTAAGGSLATHGFITHDQALQFPGIAIAVVGFGWSVIHKIKVDRAQNALAAKPSLTDPNTIKEIAKAA